MEKLTELLEKLSSELGTTTEYLWGVLIKQAQVEIYQYFVLLALTVLGIILTVMLLKTTQKYWDEYSAPAIAWINLGLGISIGLATFVGILNALFSVKSLLSAIYNPEYWALTQILEKL
ncbi:MAG: hypothetical protein H6690_03355 [Erysipelotrichaceae bacterium]|nr:hypothetical protein [Erysipelotrichaceae bacterium]